MIYRGTIKQHKLADGALCDTIWIHEYLGRGQWEVCSAGDFNCMALDLRYDRRAPKAYDALRIAHKERRSTFYYCAY